MATSVAGLPGHAAECGVFTGGSSWLICEEFQHNTNWRHHMFDSFEGLSEPDDVDRSLYGSAVGHLGRRESTDARSPAALGVPADTLARHGEFSATNSAN